MTLKTVNEGNGRSHLEFDVAFYRIEADLFRSGAAAYLTLIAKHAAHAFDQAGGIGPYEYFCTGDGAIAPHVMHAREL